MISPPPHQKNRVIEGDRRLGAGKHRISPCNRHHMKASKFVNRNKPSPPLLKQCSHPTLKSTNKYAFVGFPVQNTVELTNQHVTLSPPPFPLGLTTSARFAQSQLTVRSFCRNVRLGRSNPNRHRLSPCNHGPVCSNHCRFQAVPGQSSTSPGRVGRRGIAATSRIRARHGCCCRTATIHGDVVASNARGITSVHGILGHRRHRFGSPDPLLLHNERRGHLHRLFLYRRQHLLSPSPSFLFSRCSPLCSPDAAIFVVPMLVLLVALLRRGEGQTGHLLHQSGRTIPVGVRHDRRDVDGRWFHDREVTKTRHVGVETDVAHGGGVVVASGRAVQVFLAVVHERTFPSNMLASTVKKDYPRAREQQQRRWRASAGEERGNVKDAGGGRKGEPIGLN